MLAASLAGPADAQIHLDGSLGPAGPLAGPDYRIPARLGERRGPNLFHSFGDFNVRLGERATFTGPGGIDHVIVRVTGGTRSSIHGILRSEITGADLFLLNPAGILFGSGALLDLTGSFHASSADHLRLADGGVFPASRARPGVLTVAPPAAFGFVDPTPARLTLEPGTVLAVPAGRTLALVGGDIAIRGAGLLVPGGRVALASVRSTGELPLTPSGTAEALDVGGFSRLGAIDLLGGSLVAVDGVPAGTVVIRAGRLTLEGAGITAVTFGSADAAPVGVDLRLSGDLSLAFGSLVGTQAAGGGRSGDVVIRSRALEASGGSLIAADVGAGATGGAGTLIVDAANIGLRQGARISGTTFGAGRGGTVAVRAGETLTLSGRGMFGAPGGIFADAEVGSTGDAGPLTVGARTIVVERGAKISGSTFGVGRSGAVTVDATASLVIDRRGEPAFTGIAAHAEAGSLGDAGRLRVTAGEIALRGGGQISGSTFARGDSGGVDVAVQGALTISGRDPDGFPSGIFANGSLGDAGDLAVRARTIAIERAGTISSSAFGRGRGGAVTVDASESIAIDQRGLPAFTGIAAQAEPGSTGDAQSLTVTARDIALTGGGQISVSTFGAGDSGDVSVTAHGGLTLSGRGPGGFSSGILASAAPGSTGNAGSLRASAGAITIARGAMVGSSTFGAGRGGTVDVTAAGALVIDKAGETAFTGIAAQAEQGSTGDARRVAVAARDIALRNGAQISSATFAEGDGGRVAVTAHDALEMSGRDPAGFPSGIFATAELGSTGRAGTVSVRAGDLAVRAGAQVASATAGPGPGGRVLVAARDTLLVDGRDPDGFPSGIRADTVAGGAGGDVRVRADRLVLSDGGTVSSTSRGAGRAGNIRVEADRVEMVGGAVTTAALQADGGSIEVLAGDLVHLRDSRITSAVGTGLGAGGNITIDPPAVVLDGSTLRADAFGGPGGNVAIVAGVFLTARDAVVSASSALGVSGTVAISSPITDIAGATAPLPDDFVPAAGLLRERCGAGGVRARASRFVVGGRDRTPAEPGAPLASGLEPGHLARAVTPAAAAARAASGAREVAAARAAVAGSAAPGAVEAAAAGAVRDGAWWTLPTHEPCRRAR
jgi:filamentous hemagglutinin family protein